MTFDKRKFALLREEVGTVSALVQTYEHLEVPEELVPHFITQLAPSVRALELMDTDSLIVYFLELIEARKDLSAVYAEHHI